MILLPSLRLLAYGAGIAAVFALGLTVHRWYVSAGELEAVRQQLADERADRARDIALAAKASKGYQDEIDRLGTRAPLPAVRLCRTAPAPRTADTAARPDEASPAGGVGLQGAQGGFEQGPDIGPELDQIAARCDAVTAQLRGLQGWVTDAGN